MHLPATEINSPMKAFSFEIFKQPQMIEGVLQPIYLNWIKNNVHILEGYSLIEQNNLIGSLMLSKISPKLSCFNEELESRITGMLIDREVFSIYEIIQILSDDALMN